MTPSNPGGRHGRPCGDLVGGVIGPLNAPEALLLGLPDDAGRLRVAGRTGPLTLPARREVGALLIPAQRTHPWPERIPSSQFGQLPGDLIDYTPTEPLLVVEVDADVCFNTIAGGTRRDSNEYEQSCTRWTFRHHVTATTDELSPPATPVEHVNALRALRAPVT